ncbi:MAG: LysM peptidoglycan-binding domain-containing protein [Anaerolineae bacterium]|nr:LysM peptidoglycan-binding domain-containing protein [Anaerolineae bacterium]
MRSITLSLARWGVSVIMLATLIGLVLPTADYMVLAQGGNLLQNPGFEEPYVTLNGEDTLRLASSWQPWYLEDDGPTSNNARPEYKPAPANRVKTGASAQEFNTFFATHTAGVLQRVPVTPGTELRFSAFIYVWSSASFANPDISDDPNNVVVSVGIDPSGGMDATNPHVVWSSGAEFYDEYREISVAATSSGTAVTVFVRSVTDPEGFVGTNNVYVDEAALLPLGMVPTDTPAPTFTPDISVPVPTQEGTITPLPVTNTPLPTFTPTPALPGGYDDTVLYTVVAGDSVWGIARRFDSSVDAIIETNGLNDNGFLSIGQTLVVPVQGAAPPAIPATFTPVPTQATGTGGPLPTTSASYTVQPGDTLAGIASQFNTTVNTLAQMNNIVNPNLIFPGQELTVSGPQPTVPPAPQPTAQPTLVPFIPTITPTPDMTQPSPQPNPGTHVVQPGENLFRIGLRYNVMFDVLARANGLWNPNLIFPGQVLVIP